MATNIQSRRSKAGASLDLGIAALAAAALGFVAFAMPTDLFTSLVVQSGLPELSTAAQPPLGMKARGAAVAAAALLSFASVFLLLRALDRTPSRPRREAPAAIDPEAPRVRRADAHPDAPSRRPLLAGRELSEPIDSFEPDLPEETFADLPPAALPGFLLPDEVEAVDAENFEEADETDMLVLDQPLEEEEASPDEATGEDHFDAPALDSLVSQLPDGPEISGDETITDLMLRLESGLSRREQAIDPEVGGFEPPASEEAAWAPPPPSWLAPQAPTVEESIQAPAQPAVDEFGEPTWAQNAVRRESAARPSFAAVEPFEETAVEPEAHEPIPQEPEVRVGHRLRNAIDEMQKIAARGG